MKLKDFRQLPVCFPSGKVTEPDPRCPGSGSRSSQSSLHPLNHVAKVVSIMCVCVRIMAQTNCLPIDNPHSDTFLAGRLAVRELPGTCCCASAGRPGAAAAAGSSSAPRRRAAASCSRGRAAPSRPPGEAAASATGHRRRTASPLPRDRPRGRIAAAAAAAAGSAAAAGAAGAAGGRARARSRSAVVSSVAAVGPATPACIGSPHL